jgi:hypothetical protein
MKTVYLFLLVWFASCNNDNDGAIPKPQNPPDRTETESGRDTNRLEAPADSVRRVQDTLLQKGKAISFQSRVKLPCQKRGLLPAEHLILRG